jgi:hypothetical protein
MSQHEGAGIARLMRLPLPLIAWTELRMGLRAGAFRVVAVLAFIAGWSGGAGVGRGSGQSAYATGENACLYLGIVTVLWFALGAVRDTAQRTYVLVYTKPQPPERLALARFIGLYGQILCLTAAMFSGAIASHFAAAGNLMGIEAYGIQFVRAVCTLFFASAATYCLALLSDSPVAGSLVALYWVVALGGQDFLAKYYYPWYVQNLPAYVLFGVSLLCVALWFTRRRQRGNRPAATSVRVIAPVALIGGLWLLWSGVRHGYDSLAMQDPGLDRMSMQDIVVGELTPGFLLPDQNGRPTFLSRYQGRILLIALWSPTDPDSPLLLSRLQEAGEKYAQQGVQPISICLSEDGSAARTYAIGDQLSYPVAYDWGTSHGVRGVESSPLAIAYQASHLPRLVITDRRHRVRVVMDGLFAYESEAFNLELQKRLTDEPQ